MKRDYMVGNFTYQFFSIYDTWIMQYSNTTSNHVHFWPNTMAI